METKCVDHAICPKCKKTFRPDDLKLSEWGHEYDVNCPHCDAELTVFESIEYQVQVID